MSAASHGPRFVALVDAARARIAETTPEAVHRRLRSEDPFVLVDVRERSEWDAGHLPGAVHLGKGVIERDVEDAVPDLQTPLVLYCGGGYRSALAADALQKMGYSSVESMDGGWRAWTEAGYEVEDGPEE